jgi:hypothetical protein
VPASTLVVYGIRDLCSNEELARQGYVEGPFELLQRSRLTYLRDERSDRTRTLWPHVFDVLHDPRSRRHARDTRLAAVHESLGWPVPLVGMEILRFLTRDEASDLAALRSGARREVIQGIAAFFADGTAKDLGFLQSRARQTAHQAVERSLKGIGTIGKDRPAPGGPDAMHASEVPFVLTAAVGRRAPDLSTVAGRSVDGCQVLDDVVGWRIAIWQDLITMVAEEGAPAPYWPMDHSPEVALAGVGDALIMRSLQRYALHMLAARVGAAEPDRVLELQHVSHSLRSRVWWSGLSGDPLVAGIADALADRWDLADLADETFTGLEALASRAELEASARQAKAAHRLNVVLSYFAVISLALALLSFILDVSSDSVDATTRVLLLTAMGLISAAAALVGFRQARPRPALRPSSPRSGRRA